MRSRYELSIATNRYGLPFTNAQSSLFNVSTPVPKAVVGSFVLDA